MRLPRGLLDRLGAQAAVEHRTVNNLITAILIDGLNERSTASLTPTTAPDSKDTPA